MSQFYLDNHFPNYEYWDYYWHWELFLRLWVVDVTSGCRCRMFLLTSNILLTSRLLLTLRLLMIQSQKKPRAMQYDASNNISEADDHGRCHQSHDRCNKEWFQQQRKMPATYDTSNNTHCQKQHAMPTTMHSTAIE